MPGARSPRCPLPSLAWASWCYWAPGPPRNSHPPWARCCSACWAAAPWPPHIPAACPPPWPWASPPCCWGPPPPSAIRRPLCPPKAACWARCACSRATRPGWTATRDRWSCACPRARAPRWDRPSPPGPMPAGPRCSFPANGPETRQPAPTRGPPAPCASGWGWGRPPPPCPGSPSPPSKMGACSTPSSRETAPGSPIRRCACWPARAPGTCSPSAACTWAWWPGWPGPCSACWRLRWAWPAGPGCRGCCRPSERCSLRPSMPNGWAGPCPPAGRWSWWGSAPWPGCWVGRSRAGTCLVRPPWPSAWRIRPSCARPASCSPSPPWPACWPSPPDCCGGCRQTFPGRSPGRRARWRPPWGPRPAPCP